MDHNETAGIRTQRVPRGTLGLHVDISRRSGRTVHIDATRPLPSNRGAVIRACVDYFKQYAGYTS